MKRVIGYIMAAAMVLSLAGCGGKTSSEAETAAVIPETTEAAPAETENQMPTDGATEAPELTGFLYLTVSRLTFSVVGEREDVYIGTVPREEVTWGTEDASVAVFEDGVLTAVGVGETKAYAQFGDQRIECTVGCLAKDWEALYTLPDEILRTPKRLPPAVSEEPLTYFDDAALVGDSITYGLLTYNSRSRYLGNPLFLCRGSASVNGLVERFHNISYRGADMPFEEIVAQSGVKRVYFMLGQNDIGYQTPEQVLEKWEILVDRIQEKSPGVEIWFQSCTLGWVATGAGNSRNESLMRYNLLLKEFARERGLHYVELSAYLQDHDNKLPPAYCSDQYVHLNEQGSLIWMQVLKAHAEYRLLLESGA